MNECKDCAKLQSEVEALQDELSMLDHAGILLDIAEEYADLLAEQGKIPNTPHGKRQFILTGVKL